MEDVAVYGYITPLKVKIVLSLGLTDSVVRDADVTMVCRASLRPLIRKAYCLSYIDIPCYAYGILSFTGKPVSTPGCSI